MSRNELEIQEAWFVKETHEGRRIGNRIRGNIFEGIDLKDIQGDLNLGMPGLISA